MEKITFWNIVQLYPIGAKLIVKALKNIESGEVLISEKQNLQEGNYFSVPIKEDFDQVRNLGMEVISIKDYQDVLNQFIVDNLVELEKDNFSIKPQKPF